MNDSVLAWHFLQEDERLRYFPYTRVAVGQTLEAEPPLLLCRRGLHASRCVDDALLHAPGPIVCRVRVWGSVQHGIGKLCGRYRHVLWMADASRALHQAALAEMELLCERLQPGLPAGLAEWCQLVIDLKRGWLAGTVPLAELEDARQGGPFAWFSDVLKACPLAAWGSAVSGVKYLSSDASMRISQIARIEAVVQALAPGDYVEDLAWQQSS